MEADGGKPEREDPANGVLMEAGASGLGFMEDETLCATLQRDGHHADLSGGTRDGMSNAGDLGSSVPAEGLEAAARAR